jgi:hypothetical protein
MFKTTFISRPILQLITTKSKYVLICIQQDGTLHSLFYLEIALHFSGDTTTHHKECKQMYLQHLVIDRLALQFHCRLF